MKTILITSLLFAVSSPAAQFLVTFDTTAILGNSGAVEIQFNPAVFPGAYQPGAVTVTAFELGAGSLGSISSGPDGGASGTLPGPLVILNSDFYNGIVYNVTTFGSSASLLVDFTGLAYTASGQTDLTTFSVTLIGSSSITAVADLLGDSQLDVSFSDPGVNFSEVPEPATFALMALGLAAAVALRRRS